MMAMSMTTTADTPAIDAASPIECGKDVQHMDPPTQNAITETIGQYVAIEGHPLLVGNTRRLTVMMQNIFIITH